MKMRKPMDYKAFKKRIWLGTLIVNALSVPAVLAWDPRLAFYLAFGVIMGWFYLWSLFFNSEHPKGKIQFVFSLTRIAMLAYIIVVIAQGSPSELAIVMCGLLSYKGILWLEYLRQALPAFRFSKKRKQEA